MTSTLKNVVSNGLVGSTVSVGYSTVAGATVGGVISAVPYTNSRQYTIGTNTSINSSCNVIMGGGGGSSAGVIITDKNMSVGVPLEVNGRDILKELDELRDAMLLLTRHVDMEAKYPKLKELKDAYQRQLEKYKTFDAIKDSK
jgi:hypothetical protein